MPNFKSISFKMAVLQGGGQNLPSPCVCYPKDPMWNRVKKLEVEILSYVLFKHYMFLQTRTFSSLKFQGSYIRVFTVFSRELTGQLHTYKCYISGIGFA